MATPLELTLAEVEIIRRSRLSPIAYATEQRAKAKVRLDNYLASMTTRDRIAWYTAQDRLASLTPDERAFERIVRTRIRMTGILQQAPYVSILSNLVRHPNLLPEVLEEAEELALLVVVEDEKMQVAPGGFIAWLKSVIGL